MKGLFAKLDDSMNFLELDTHSLIYTNTVCKHSKYLVTRLRKHRKRRASLCTYRTSVTPVRQIECIKVFDHLPVVVEAPYMCSKLYMCVPHVVHAHVARYLRFKRQSKNFPTAPAAIRPLLYKLQTA